MKNDVAEASLAGICKEYGLKGISIAAKIGDLI